jgi:amino acid permease
MALDDLGIVLSVVGATGSVVVTYLLPGFCYYRLCLQPRSWLRRAALLQTLLGAILMPVSLALIMTKK